MDSDESSDERTHPSTTVERQRVKNEDGMRRAKHHLIKYNNRQITDRYWSGFFVVIFIIWIVSCRYVTHYEMDDNIFLDDSTDASNTTESDYQDAETTEHASVLIYHDTNNGTVSSNNTSRKTKLLTPSKFIVWYLEVFACNTYHLLEFQKIFVPRTNDDGKPERVCQGWFNPVLLFHIFIAGSILLLSLWTISDNKIFCQQPTIIGATFLFVALFEHLLAVLYADNSITFSLLPSHEKLACWMIPEMLFFIIWISKMYPTITYKHNAFDDDDDDDGEDMMETNPLSLYKTTIIVGIPVFVILQLLAFYTMSILQNVTWGSTMFYVITGGSFYVGLTVYYLGLMIVPCAMHLAVLSSQSPLKSSLNGLSTVLRYHFGTACYRATLIFPRIHAISLIGDQKLKALSKYSIIDRLWATNWTLHKHSATITATFGTNYSDSLRELLRFWSCGLISKSGLHNYGPIMRALLGFLLSTNGLLLIMICLFGQDEPQLSLATWAMYLKMMLIFYLAIAFFQATSDALDFHALRKMLIESNPNGRFVEAIMALTFRGYFNEFQLAGS